MPRLRITVLTVVFTLLATGSAGADDAKDKARPHVKAADTHYKLGRFAEALTEYSAAYEIYPAPPILFNIAQCNRNLGNFEAAVFSYEAYLRANPKAKNKKLVEDLIKDSRKALAAQRAAAAKAAEDEAARAAAEADALVKKAEEDRKAQEADAARTAEQARLAEEQRKAEEIRAADSDKERQRLIGLEKTYNRHPARKWSYIGGGVGAAIAITGAVFAFKSRSAQSRFDDAGCGDPNVLLDATELAQCESDRDAGERDALLGNVLLGTGGAVLVGSALVFIIDPGNISRPAEARRAEVKLTPTSIKLVVRW